MPPKPTTSTPVIPGSSTSSRASSSATTTARSTVTRTPRTYPGPRHDDGHRHDALAIVNPAKSTYDDLTALGLTNVSSADATAASGLASRNDVRGGAFAWITNETATATGGISVTALETATIRATGDSTANAHGGSLFDSDKSKGMSFQIATNVMLSGATATVTNSVLKATGGDVAVSADNTSTLEALMKTIVESPSLAIGATLAFNSIGWDSQNILFNLGNALLGLNPGTENAAKTIAKVTGSTISVGGSIAVTANSLASITAVVETSATSITASLTDKASSIAIDVVVAMNRVSTEVKASIESAPTVTGAPSVEAKAGSVSVLATDDASIYSFVDAPVLAVAASADKATGVTVALSVSRNEVATDLAATITGVPSVTATGGNITVRATQSSWIDATSTASAVTVALSLGKSLAFSGGGATAVNKIGGNTNATINGGTMTATARRRSPARSRSRRRTARSSRRPSARLPSRSAAGSPARLPGSRSASRSPAI